MLTHSLNTPRYRQQGQPRRLRRPLQPTSSAPSLGMPVWWRAEFSYRKDEEIYGEDEPAEYVYQVITGAVRSYKLLSDGRRQIGAFHLPGDVFGLEFGNHAPAGHGSHHRHHRAAGEAQSLEQAAGRRCPGRAQALDHDGRRSSPCRRPHAPARPQDGDGAGRYLPSGNGPPARGRRHDGAADVPPGYRRLSRPDAGDRVAGAFPAPEPGRSRLLRRAPDRAAQPPAAAQLDA